MRENNRERRMRKMKLAIALSERADLQRRISEINTRLNRNAKVQEGEVPSEEPASLLQELDDCLTRLETLIVRINRTNQATIRDERSIADRIAERDCLRQRIQILRDFLGAASDKVDRYSKTEIKIHSTVDVAALQKEIDTYSRTLRKLEETIQELNWTTELTE